MNLSRGQQEDKKLEGRCSGVYFKTLTRRLRICQRPDWPLIYLQFYEYFLWILAIELNSLAVLSKRAHRFEGKLNICRDEQYVLNLAAFMSILEKTTTVLKFVVDSINLGLCDSHYVFLITLKLEQRVIYQ